MRLEVDGDRAPARLREAAIQIAQLFLGLSLRRLAPFQGDLHKAVIAHAVAMNGLRRLIANPTQLESFADIRQELPLDMLVPSSALSIAEATGMPRETVRRKLKEMVADRILMEDERGGYIFRASTMEMGMLAEVLTRDLGELAERVNALVAAGILKPGD